MRSRPGVLVGPFSAIESAPAPLGQVTQLDRADRHPLQILAQLHNHYTRLAKLDGRDIASIADAESALGIKGFPAEKAYNTFRSIGHDGVRRAFELLSRADSDLRGGTGLEEDVVMDVLVARLARLAPTVSRRR